jgi:hypothetical protein
MLIIKSMIVSAREKLAYYFYKAELGKLVGITHKGD